MYTMPGADFTGSRKGGRWRARNRKCGYFLPSLSSGASACPHQTGSPRSLCCQSSLTAQTMLPTPSDVSPQGPILNPHLPLRRSGCAQCGRPQLPRPPSRLGRRGPSQEPRWQRRQGRPLPELRHRRGEHTATTRRPRGARVHSNRRP